MRSEAKQNVTLYRAANEAAYADSSECEEAAIRDNGSGRAKLVSEMIKCWLLLYLA